MILILFAIFIDGLQAALAWAFFTMGSVFATATAGLGAGAVPLGIGVGMGVDICIDTTLGVALITALGIFDMFDLKSVIGGSLFELIPGLDLLPGWTAMAIACVIRSKAKEGGALGAVAKIATAGSDIARGNVGAVVTDIGVGRTVGQEAYATAA